jgi:hypothetical protein
MSTALVLKNVSTKNVSFLLLECNVESAAKLLSMGDAAAPGYIAMAYALALATKTPAPMMQIAILQHSRRKFAVLANAALKVVVPQVVSARDRMSV